MIYLINLYINLQLRKMCVLGSCFLLRGVTASVFTETPTPTGKIKSICSYFRYYFPIVWLHKTSNFSNFQGKNKYIF